MINKILRYLFFLFIIKPFILIIIGLNVRHFDRLCLKGPAILAANHNSHLDTMVLMSLFPITKLGKLRPVAAADYFLRNKFLKWFSTKIIGIIPLQRKLKNIREDYLKDCSTALDNGNILIFFPEGSRGEPERLTSFKKGLAHLAKRHPKIAVIPVFLHGCGKALPKDEGIIVPFFCDVFIGEKLLWNGDRNKYMEEFTNRINHLAAEGKFPTWD